MVPDQRKFSKNGISGEFSHFKGNRQADKQTDILIDILTSQTASTFVPADILTFGAYVAVATKHVHLSQIRTIVRN